MIIAKLGGPASRHGSLNSLFQATPLAETVTLSMSPDTPLVTVSDHRRRSQCATMVRGGGGLLSQSSRDVVMTIAQATLLSETVGDGHEGMCAHYSRVCANYCALHRPRRSRRQSRSKCRLIRPLSSATRSVSSVSPFTTRAKREQSKTF